MEAAQSYAVLQSPLTPHRPRAEGHRLLSPHGSPGELDATPGMDTSLYSEGHSSRDSPMRAGDATRIAADAGTGPAGGECSFLQGPTGLGESFVSASDTGDREVEA